MPQFRPNTVFVRQLISEDAKLLIPLQTACFPHISSKSVGIHFVHRQDYFTFGAFLEGELVGTVSTQKRWGHCGKVPSREEDRRVLKPFHRPSYLANLAVICQLGGKEVASLLLRLAIQKEEQEGADAVYLHVMVTNKKAIRLYEKMGFVKRGFILNFYNEEAKRGRSRDALVCVRSI